MAKMKPIEQANMLENEYRNYVKSTFALNDEVFYSKFEKEMENVELLKGPFLNKNLPFKSGETIDNLIKLGKLHKDFAELGGLKLNRPLYIHQIEALEKISNGRSVVVTTGTGSGKTESFLYPIINHILNDPEIDKPGVRAIFLFPMNALVNDQMKRVRELLSTYPKIKFGRYVGDTKDNVNPESERKRLKNIYGDDIPINELVTREQIRENPPHLLFTNYSMLEYLLLRPKDNSILDEKNANKWQFIVLDEAHTYAGALGIEVGMLLRRLQERINRKTQFILTSATLGHQNKDEKDIIDFAFKLTGADYEDDDIIFSTRKQLPEEGNYRLSEKEYVFLKEQITKLQTNIPNTKEVEEQIKSYLSKYVGVTNKKINILLKEVLEKDSNVLLLNKILDGPVPFMDAFRYFKIFNLTEKGFSDLIFLISYVFSETRELYDIKYHTFVRTIDGCFVTLNADKNLSLQRCLYIEDYKTFEIGKCKKCDAVYIIGKIEGSKLRQNTDLDIYENEGDTDSVVDYFIFEEDVSNYDQEFLEKYKLCIKCGSIYDADETHPTNCECGEDNIITIYRVKKDKNENKANINSLYNNNITYCPCCRKSSNNGIVSSFYLGKDATTAVLTQILLKVIDDQNREKETVNVAADNPFIVVDTPKETTQNDYVKQLIEFSDGRQQASFAATFCEYNHERFLRKKLLFDVVNDSDTPISFSTLRSKLENRIEKNNLFDNKYALEDCGSNKNAWITILNELLCIDGNNSAEGLGLYAFGLDFTFVEEYLEYLPAAFANSGIDDYSLSFEEIKTILSIIINVFRHAPAIDYDESDLSIEDKKEEFSYRMFDNYVMFNKAKGAKIASSKKEDSSNNIRSLIPVNANQSNKLIDYVMSCTGYDFNKSKKFIEVCFILLRARKILVPDEANTEIYKIKADKFRLFGRKTLKWYRCEKCKTITPYNCKNVCPNCAQKSLIICDPDVVLKDNYYRKEYANKKVERLVFKEHTGQLTSEQGLKIQKAFVAKQVNVLSCSTTFEMGVDIGSLETVFMRNVPPTPANYVQRAGRAGRGKDSSAFILTFCGNSSHDYTYFTMPEKMVSGKITPPYFKLNNEKIVLRHILDTALSFFLRNHEDDFSCVGNFIADYHMFENYVRDCPKDLGEFIDNFIEDTQLIKYKNFGWIEDVFDNDDGLLHKYYQEFVSEINWLEEKSNEELAKGNDAQSSYFKGEISKLKQNAFIDAMANANIIPRYGFPIDCVNLKVAKDVNKVDLNRDLQIALSEYAPDCEVIANGRKYTSRYIIIPKNKEMTKYYYFTCLSCGKTNYSIDKNSLVECCNCNEKHNGEISIYICPNKGFKADFKTATSKVVKPKKSYSNEIEYIGNGVTEMSFSFNNMLELVSNKDDELLVLNKGPFFTCKKCGYSIIDQDFKKERKLKIEENGHSNGFEPCGNKHLDEIALGYTFKTDVVKFVFKSHYSFDAACSFLYALLDGISSTFLIERNDINGVLSREKNDTYSVIIYDDVPGGAGHVKKLLNENSLRKVLLETLAKVESCKCDIHTSCYNCLRNYKNQRRHKHLSRKGAIKVIKETLG